MRIFVFIVVLKLINQFNYMIYMPVYTDLARFQTMISLFIFFIIVGIIRYLIRRNSGKIIFDIILLFFILGWNGIVWEVFYQGKTYVFFAMGYSILTLSILLYLIIFRKRVYPEKPEPVITQEYSDTSTTVIGLDNEIEQPLSLEVSDDQLDDDLIDYFNPIVCPTCGKENVGGTKVCGSCDTEFPICIICNKPINKDDIVFCPFCKQTYHKLEFFEWLKTEEACKKCLRALELSEILEIFKQESEPIETSFLCPICKKLIPNDSHFCIYCGSRIHDYSD